MGTAPTQTASRDAIANFEQNVGDALAGLTKLQTGLDVNVRFSEYVVRAESLCVGGDSPFADCPYRSYIVHPWPVIYSFGRGKGRREAVHRGIRL